MTQQPDHLIRVTNYHFCRGTQHKRLVKFRIDLYLNFCDSGFTYNLKQVGQMLRLTLQVAFNGHRVELQTSRTQFTFELDLVLSQNVVSS